MGLPKKKGDSGNYPRIKGKSISNCKREHRKMGCYQKRDFPDSQIRYIKKSSIVFRIVRVGVDLVMIGVWAVMLLMCMRFCFVAARQVSIQSKCKWQ